MQNFWRQARFPSGPCRNICLITHPVPEWRNGRRRGFKIPRLHGRVSSNLTLGTTHPRNLLILLYLRNKLAFQVLIQVLILFLLH